MAQLIITTTPEQDARIVAAFGKELQLGRDALGVEIKAWLIDKVRAVVIRWERSEAALAIPPPAPLDPE